MFPFLVAAAVIITILASVFMQSISWLVVASIVVCVTLFLFGNLNSNNRIKQKRAFSQTDLSGSIEKLNFSLHNDYTTPSMLREVVTPTTNSNINYISSDNLRLFSLDTSREPNDSKKTYLQQSIIPNNHKNLLFRNDKIKTLENTENTTFSNASLNINKSYNSYTLSDEPPNQRFRSLRRGREGYESDEYPMKRRSINPNDKLVKIDSGDNSDLTMPESNDNQSKYEIVSEVGNYMTRKNSGHEISQNLNSPPLYYVWTDLTEKVHQAMAYLTALPRWNQTPESKDSSTAAIINDNTNIDVTTIASEDRDINSNDSYGTSRSSNKRNREAAELEVAAAGNGYQPLLDSINQSQSNKDYHTIPLLSNPKRDIDSQRRGETVPAISTPSATTASATTGKRRSPVRQIFGAKSPLHLLKAKSILKTTSFDAADNKLYSASVVSQSVSVSAWGGDARDDRSVLNDHDAAAAAAAAASNSDSEPLILPRRKQQRIDSNVSNDDENSTSNLYIPSYHHSLKLPLLRKRIEAIATSSSSDSWTELSNKEKSTDTAIATNSTSLSSTLLLSSGSADLASAAAYAFNSTVTATTTPITSDASTITSSSFSFELQPVSASVIFNSSIPSASTDSSNRVFAFQSPPSGFGQGSPPAITTPTSPRYDSFDARSSSALPPTNNGSGDTSIATGSTSSIIDSSSQTHPQHKQDSPSVQLPDPDPAASSPSRSRLSTRSNSSSSPPSQGAKFAPFLFSQSPVAPPLAPGKPPPSPPTAQHRVGELSFSKGIAFLSSSRGSKSSENPGIDTAVADPDTARHSNAGVASANPTSEQVIIHPPVISSNQDNKFTVENSAMPQPAFVFPSNLSFGSNSNSFSVNTTATPPTTSLPAPVFSFGTPLAAPPQLSFPSFAAVSTPSVTASAGGFSFGLSSSSAQTRKKVKPRLKDR